MRIAVATDSGQVSAHFGRCPEFTLVDIEDNKELKREILPNPGHTPGNIPAFLKDHGAKVIVAGGMGQRAKLIFDESGIQQVVGVSGSTDTAIAQFIEGNLSGGESTCTPKAGIGYGLDKTICDHE